MWPEIPENFNDLSGAEQLEVARKFAKAVRANSTRTMSPEETDEWNRYRELAERMKLSAQDTLAEEAEAAEAAEAAAKQEESQSQSQASSNTDDGDDDGDGENDEDGEGDADADGQHSAPVGAGLQLATTRETISVTASRFVRTGAVPGHTQGASIANEAELAQAVMEAAQAMTAGASSRVEVAKLSANWGDRTPDEYQLDNDHWKNLARFNDMRRNPQALQAAFCAPATPLYDIACDSTDRRPVRASLPTFKTPTRGAFSVFPSPTLADVDSGWGRWTSEDDADPEAIKEACATITCGSPTEYEIYGVYACLTVKNLVQMTFPELVAAYLNRLMAQRARYAETLLLEAMANGADVIDTPTFGYGANVSLKRILLQYLAHYQNLERWDIDTADAWMPRWLLWALKIDAISRRTTDGSYPRVPSTAEIEASFRDIGIEPHWYMDRPSWATPVNPLAVAGDLTFLPSSVEILVARRGKFALLDRGDLTIGVAPNNIYRLGDDLRRNQFTMFFESFEGLIDTDTCPAHLLQIPNLCYNGAQIADIAIDCEGEFGVIGS